MKFSPCTGKCTEEGTNCEGCGRSHEEIAEMKIHIANLVTFAEKMEYENIEDFANGVAGSIKYKMGEGHKQLKGSEPFNFREIKGSEHLN